LFTADGAGNTKFISLPLPAKIKSMGLPLRITFKDEDYIYQINDSNQINQNTTELELVINGSMIKLKKDLKKSWIQNGGDETFDAELIQALGRSVSLRLRM
jgi:hypothetical protein